ncbi:hypothetical protein KFE25_008213 [Diacronema lutheri]|uniref:Adenosylmethionine decarboxylase n=3 Tax=Diacronema lutheri TaxID=2081491 RepID=A0A8J5XUL9_DIALT|nr:hypothetical protein KFE25_008213 [Diacronema lutheri]
MAPRVIIALSLVCCAHAFIGPLSHRVGTHLVLEIWGVDARALDDRRALEHALRDASRAAGLTVLEAAFHRFEPQGVTGVLVLSESHISVHTWPELGYAAIDLFSCGVRRELPCSESAARSGGGGEVTMRMRAAGGGGSGGGGGGGGGKDNAWMQPFAGWRCADGSPPAPGGGGAEAYAIDGRTPHVAPTVGEAPDERFDQPKDLWAAIDALVRSLRPSDVQLRRFERGVPASTPAAGAPVFAAAEL